MNRKTNIINNAITIGLSIALTFFMLVFCKFNYNYKIGKIILFSVCGAIIFAVLNVFFHEIGHVIFGKANGFTLIELTIFFFKWTKTKEKTQFSLVKYNDCAGSTQMALKSDENAEEKIIKMTRGGAIFNAILMVICIVPFFLTSIIPMWAYVLWAVGLPVSVYSFLSAVLPVSSFGARNDAGVIYGLKRNDDESKVMINLFKIESLLLNGKSPKEIDRNLYYDVPQLPEDSLTFLSLLSARYFYNVDVKNYDEAKAIISRMLMLTESLPNGAINLIKTYALYSYCTFDFSEDDADDFMLELEKHLNANNDALNVLTKLAYILRVDGNCEFFDKFYNKGMKEANKMKLKGLGTFYCDRLNELKKENA